jgi:hypothetical protein
MWHKNTVPLYNGCSPPVNSGEKTDLLLQFQFGEKQLDVNWAPEGSHGVGGVQLIYNEVNILKRVTLGGKHTLRTDVRRDKTESL